MQGKMQKCRKQWHFNISCCRGQKKICDCNEKFEFVIETKHEFVYDHSGTNNINQIIIDLFTIQERIMRNCVFNSDRIMCRCLLCEFTKTHLMNAERCASIIYKDFCLLAEYKTLNIVSTLWHQQMISGRELEVVAVLGTHTLVSAFLEYGNSRGKGGEIPKPLY